MVCSMRVNYLSAAHRLQIVFGLGTSWPLLEIKGKQKEHPLVHRRDYISHCSLQKVWEAGKRREAGVSTSVKVIMTALCYGLHVVCVSLGF